MVTTFSDGATGTFTLDIGSELLTGVSATRLGIATADPQAPLHVRGATLLEGDVQMGSSRVIKEGFEPVCNQELLEGLLQLPLSSWSYRDDETAARHIGPVAEDFSAIFGLGAEPGRISPIDGLGVLIGALQALHDRFEAVLREHPDDCLPLPPEQQICRQPPPHAWPDRGGQ